MERLNIHMTRRLFAAAVALLLSLSAGAQFYMDGGDPGKLRWYSIESDNYKIIYPEGLDSLARVYGGQLERYRIPVSRSSGLVPGGSYRTKTPVVLHAWSATSNGSVVWAPKRMELYTTPEAYSPEPVPWEQNLAVHESRHVAQMQAGYRGAFRPFTWLLGEMIPGAVAGVYPGPMFLEGDAVVAETALTSAGRGRSGDFMNYYMSAFDNGDFRSFRRWQYGSWRHYAPNHYAAGYMAIAGKRVFFSDTLLTRRYFNTISRRPLRLNHFKREMARGTGMKFNEVYDSIMVSFHNIWKREAASRAPFTDVEPMTPVPGWFTSYQGAVPVGGDIYVRTNGLIRPMELKRIGEDGRETSLRPFSATSSRLSASGSTIWWSETVTDARWSMKQDSRIRYMDTEDGRIHDLTKHGRYFNPVPSPDGKTVAAVEYPVTGGTSVVVLDAVSGREILRRRMPDGFQAYEVAWLAGSLAVAAISSDGSGVYLMDEDGLEELLAPQPVSLHSLSAHNGKLIFTSDRTGVNEIYSFDAAGRSLVQLTSSRYGAGDGFFKADTLFYTSLTSEGRLMYRIPEENLLYKEVEFSDIHHYEVADALSAQERALAGGRTVADVQKVTFTVPKRYRKLAHIPNFHSWAPVYMINSFDVDGSLDQLSSFGVTGFFQNLLGTAMGSIGVGGMKETGGSGFRPAAFLNLTYTGLYPEIEFSGSIGERGINQYGLQTLFFPEYGAYATRVYSEYDKETPNARASVKVGVPLNFSSGGLLRGVRPSLSYTISNDRYDKSMHTITMKRVVDTDTGEPTDEFEPVSIDIKSGRNVFMQTLSASVSGYVMRQRGPSQEYPSYGIGGEIGYQCRLGLADLYTAGIYAHAYGYLPGLAKSHGLRLGALYQHRLEGDCLFGENVVNTHPRGFVDTDFMTYLSTASSRQLKLSVDYSLPIYLGDQTWASPVAYITHYMIRPYVDFMMFDDKNTAARTMFGNYAVTSGADITARMSNFFWLPFDTEIGVRIGFNNITGMEQIDKALKDMFPDSSVYTTTGGFYLGFLFSIDI